MAKKFSELRAKMSPEARERSALKAQALRDEMPLHELRQARGLSQKMLAEVLHVQQPSVAKLEKRTDMYLSTLRSHIEAMGGVLDVIARFPDGSVTITNFNKLDTKKTVKDVLICATGMNMRKTPQLRSDWLTIMPDIFNHGLKCKNSDEFHHSLWNKSNKPVAYHITIGQHPKIDDDSVKVDKVKAPT